jgi:probable HAF family extracellular repeat protein
MQRFLSALLALAALIGVMALAAAAPRAEEKSAAKTYYAVVDLGTLGGTHSVAEGISDRGWVVGSANLAGDQSEHAYLWRDGLMTDLGTLGGPNSSEQWAVDDNRGLIAAVGETSTKDPLGEDFCGFNTGLTCLGFLWQDGKKTPLATLGGDNSQALAVNNLGQVVGYAENDAHDPTCLPPQVLDFEAVIWGPSVGEIQQLPTLPGDTVSAASGINDRGQVIGVSGTCAAPTSRGVLWQDGTVTDLGDLGGVLNTLPYAINSSGDVVGQSDLTGDTTLHAFLWTKTGGMRDLGTLPGDPASSAFGISDDGQVVGGSCVDASFSNCRAFLWQNGVMTDLNTLVRPGSTPLYLFFGNDINDDGEIAAYAYDRSNGQFHAALAIPCDASHAGDPVCKDSAAGSTAQAGESVDRPSVTLPASVREQLRRRLSLGLVGAWSVPPE